MRRKNKFRLLYVTDNDIDGPVGKAVPFFVDGIPFGGELIGQALSEGLPLPARLPDLPLFQNFV